MDAHARRLPLTSSTAFSAASRTAFFAARFAACLTAFFVVIGAAPLAAAASATVDTDDVEVRVLDRNGEPVTGAAVILPVSATASGAGKTAVMDQRDEQFHPRLLVVQTGTTVNFPNNDTVMHHVYSFSDTKTFELPLYQANQAPPITFEHPGMVVLGCNIHDQMIGHILVVDTPHFGYTGPDGTVRLPRVAGASAVQVWYRAGFGYESFEQPLPEDGQHATVRLEPVPTAIAGDTGASLKWHIEY